MNEVPALLNVCESYGGKALERRPTWVGRASVGGRGVGTARSSEMSNHTTVSPVWIVIVGFSPAVAVGLALLGGKHGLTVSLKRSTPVTSCAAPAVHHGGVTAADDVSRRDDPRDAPLKSVFIPFSSRWPNSPIGR